VALLRSRSYLRLLVLAAILGVPISAAAYGFLALVSFLQEEIFTDLPHGLGFSTEPVWWPLPVLAVGGVLAGFAIRYLPGRGGPSPAGGFGQSRAALGGGIGRLGRIPQVSHHVHAPPFYLGGLRVLISVDHVLVDRQRHQGENLRLLPGLAERGKVLPRVAIEHQLIRHQLERIPGERPLPS